MRKKAKRKYSGTLKMVPAIPTRAKHADIKMIIFETLVFSRPNLISMWCRWFLSGIKGFLPLIARLVMTVNVSVMGTARTSRGATGGTILVFVCVSAIERNVSAKPMVRLPASPIKRLDGCQLYLRKAISEPQNAIESSSSAVWLFRNDRIAKDEKAVRATPPESPSSPSIMLMAFITPTVEKIVRRSAERLNLIWPKDRRLPK